MKGPNIHVYLHCTPMYVLCKLKVLKMEKIALCKLNVLNGKDSSRQLHCTCEVLVECVSLSTITEEEFNHG